MRFVRILEQCPIPRSSYLVASSLIRLPYYIECNNVIRKGQRTYTNLIIYQESNKYRSILLNSHQDPIGGLSFVCTLVTCVAYLSPLSYWDPTCMRHAIKIRSGL